MVGLLSSEPHKSTSCCSDRVLYPCSIYLRLTYRSPFPAVNLPVSSFLFPVSQMAQGLVTGSLTGPTLDLVSHIEELLQRQASNPRQRMLVALAGVPGSGKSTVSHALLQELAIRGIKDIAIVPMVSPGHDYSPTLDVNRYSRMVSITPKRLSLGFEILRWPSRGAEPHSLLTRALF